jgi:LmbE family N-acetylglucosaminyl deacetylase
MSTLIVVAHPDDEVLGCGATASAIAAGGVAVRACLLCANADARGARPSDSDLLADTREAQRLLGLGEPILGAFPNIRLNTVPHLELVQFIERAILETGATTVFTHHPGDINDDHVHTARACLAAARLFQRRAGVPRLRHLYYMEILSSTDWSFPGGESRFEADTFFEAGEYLEKKLAALRAYRGVVRDFPHPRSAEIVRALAAYRGGQAGMRHAEAFQTAFTAVSGRDFT